MNRLVIIGNGFDLAHKWPTKYSDFLLALFKKSVYTVLEGTHKIRTPFFEIEKNESNQYKPLNWDTVVESFKNIKEILGDNFDKHDPGINFDLKIKRTDTFGHLFIPSLLDKNWCDIEAEYSKKLIEQINLRTSSPTWRELNADFNQIKENLKEYLKDVDETEDRTNLPHKQLIYKLIHNFDPMIYGRYFKNDPYTEMNRMMYEKKLDVKHQVKIINFNYTSLLESYFDHFESDLVEVINIHGTINDDIIFGNGDEKNSEYVRLIKSHSPQIFEHSKSLFYTLNNQRRDLTNFLKSFEYEAVILGHSLGMTDGVLFSQIFDNDNCKAIRLFHRGTVESYMKKLGSLRRHFNYDSDFNEKVVSYNPKEIFQ